MRGYSIYDTRRQSKAMPKTRFKTLKNELKRRAKPSEVNIPGPTAGLDQGAKGPSQGEYLHGEYLLNTPYLIINRGEAPITKTIEFTVQRW